MRRFPHALLAGAGFALVLPACGGAELTAPVETMVEFETKWQCDVARFAFASSDEIDAKREETRARFGVSAEDHKIFTDMLEDDETLRDSVAAGVDGLCPVVDEAEEEVGA